MQLKNMDPDGIMERALLELSFQKLKKQPHTISEPEFMVLCVDMDSIPLDDDFLKIKAQWEF